MSAINSPQLKLPASRDIPVFGYRTPLHGIPARIAVDSEARQLVAAAKATWVNRGTAIQLCQSDALEAAGPMENGYIES